jgi:hypothetical protein
MRFEYLSNKIWKNACAKSLNDYFKIGRIGDHIGNHLKTLKKVHHN